MECNIIGELNIQCYTPAFIGSDFGQIGRFNHICSGYLIRDIASGRWQSYDCSKCRDQRNFKYVKPWK